jgi:hypothetical protein
MFLRVQYLDQLLFLLNINDLPNITDDLSKPVLLAEDMSIIITNPSPSKLKEDINRITVNINEWFKVNSLTLNFDKTCFL